MTTGRKARIVATTIAAGSSVPIGSSEATESPARPARVAAASSQHGRLHPTIAASERVTSAAVTVARLASPPRPITRARPRCGPITASGATQTRAHQRAATAAKPSPTSRAAADGPARRATATPVQVRACAAAQPSSRVPIGTGQATPLSGSAAATATLSGPR
jgi:hypothetical protein